MKRRKFIETSFDDEGFSRCEICKKEIHQEDRDGGGNRLITVDHVVPLSKGGPDDYDNYMLMCKACNLLKGSMFLDEFLLMKKFMAKESLTDDEKDVLLQALIGEKIHFKRVTV